MENNGFERVDTRNDDMLDRVTVGIVVIFLALAFTFSIYIQARTLGQVDSVENRFDEIELLEQAMIQRNDCIITLLSILPEERTALLQNQTIEQICGGPFIVIPSVDETVPDDPLPPAPE